MFFATNSLPDYQPHLQILSYQCNLSKCYGGIIHLLNMLSLTPLSPLYDHFLFDGGTVQLSFTQAYSNSYPALIIVSDLF